MRHAVVGGHRIRLRVTGSGPDLLLVNGVGANLEMWEPLVRALPGRRLIAYDAPGSGGSATPVVPLTMAGQAQIAAGVLDHLGVARSAVLGLSFGGMVAQQLALDAPSRVTRLVLASTSPGWGGVPGSPLALALLSSPLRYYSRTAFEQTAPWLFGGRAPFDTAFLTEQGRARHAAPPDPVGYLHQLLAAAAWSSLPWLGRIRTATLVLAGGEDPLVPVGNAAVLASALRDARLEVVPDGGHLLLLDSAAALAPLLTDFLDGTAADERSAP